jgi:hypothetical protein
MYSPKPHEREFKTRVFYSARPEPGWSMVRGAQRAREPSTSPCRRTRGDKQSVRRLAQARWRRLADVVRTVVTEQPVAPEVPEIRGDQGVTAALQIPTSPSTRLGGWFEGPPEPLEPSTKAAQDERSREYPGALS